MKSIIASFILLVLSLITYGQNNEYSKLDSLFTILQENDRFFGSVAVSQGGKIIYSKALGYADLKTKTANNKETKFRIGSISKTFTATLIMKAVELGHLNLDDSIDNYFPRVQNAKEITVRHLLNHRSGISNFTDRNYMNWHTVPITQAALLDTILTKGIDFEPNTDYAYSNSNYVLLTFILEKAFDKAYDQILQQYILDPLKLDNTNYGSVINPIENEAISYYMGSEWNEHSQDDMSIPLGAGGIVSTPIDLCRFIEGLFKGQLISHESLEQMKPVGDQSYGFALYGTPFVDKNGWGHGGNIDAFASNVIYFEESDLSIAMSCNGSNYGSHDVEVAVLSEIFDQPYTLPSFEFVELMSEDLDQYLGTYVTDELPMDMTVTKEGNTLYLGVTGQSASALTAKGDHKFEVTKYGVKMTFIPEEGRLHFEQQGMAFDLVLQSMEDKAEEVTTTTQAVEPISKNELEQYVGTYKSDELPIDLTIKIDGDKLIGQGDGQPSFSLIAQGEHTYGNEEIGLVITFAPDENKMNLNQSGAAFEMVLKE